MKTLYALLLIPMLALAACGPIAGTLTNPVDNPLTPKIAYDLHASFAGGVVVASAHYAGLVRCPAPAPCSEQKVVDAMRSYINKADASLRDLDAWAVGNTKLNGPALYQAALLAVTTAQSFATTNGVK